MFFKHFHTRFKIVFSHTFFYHVSDYPQRTVHRRPVSGVERIGPPDFCPCHGPCSPERAGSREWLLADPANRRISRRNLKTTAPRRAAGRPAPAWPGRRRRTCRGLHNGRGLAKSVWQRWCSCSTNSGVLELREALAGSGREAVKGGPRAQCVRARQP